MTLYPFFHGFKKWSATFLLAILIYVIFIPVSGAVTRFGTVKKEKERPVPFSSEDIWFYDRDMSKVIAEMDLAWLTVVFAPGLIDPEIKEMGDVYKDRLRQWAKEIVNQYGGIIDFFYDQNLAEDACFFRLRDDIKGYVLQNLIRELNQKEFVSYTHPTIKIKGKTYAFFDAFEMEWKTGVDAEIKADITSQVHVWLDKKENVYRVDLFQIPLFEAINLLAEDIHVLKATPYLVELKPTISADLALAIHGGAIADKVPFSLNVIFSELISIDPSSIANIDLRPTGIQKELFELKFDPYDYLEAASRSPIRITGWMKFFTPGEFVIPPVEMKYTCSTCSGKQVRSIETKSVPFKVSRIVPSKEENTTLIVPMDYPSPDYKIDLYRKKALSNLILALSSFFLALVCIAWFIAKLYAVRKQRERVQAKKKEEVLAEDLRLFLQKGPAGPHWIFLGELSKILRDYLVERYKITDYPTGGSGEVFYESIRKALPENLAPKIYSLFKEVDDAVALELDTHPDIESFRSQVLEVIGSP
jgi:hypothetical protein